MNKGRSRWTRRIGLALAIGVIALFGALVVVQDGTVKLYLGGIALIASLAAVQQVRAKPGAQGQPGSAEEGPAGPWLAGATVFAVSLGIALSTFLPSNADDSLRFFIYSMCFGAAWIAGQLVKAAVSRLPRYRIRGADRAAR